MGVWFCLLSFCFVLVWFVSGWGGFVVVVVVWLAGWCGLFAVVVVVVFGWVHFGGRIVCCFSFQCILRLRVRQYEYDMSRWFILKTKQVNQCAIAFGMFLNGYDYQPGFSPRLLQRFVRQN